VDTGIDLHVVKEDGNAYTFDGTGSTYPLTHFPVVPDFDGHGHGRGLVAIPGTSLAVYNGPGGLLLISGDAKPRPIGPDAIKGNQAIANVTYEPHRGRHYETVIAPNTNWMYSLFRVVEDAVAKTYLLAGEIVPAGSGFGVRWHGLDRFDGVVRGLFIDSQSRLWWAFVTGGAIGYHKLGEDGSPDAGRDAIGYGATSTTYALYTPEDDGGYPHVMKYLHHIEIALAGTWSGGTPLWSTQYLVDGGAPSAFVTQTTWPAGPTVVRHWNAGAYGVVRSGYRWRFGFQISTDGSYSPTASNISVLSLAATLYPFPIKSDSVRFVVDTGIPYSTESGPIDSAKAIRDTLRAFAYDPISPSSTPFTDPDGNSGYMIITEVSDTMTGATWRPEPNAQPQAQDLTKGETNYLIEVRGIVWRTG
jgi:hypothetical protein